MRTDEEILARIKERKIMDWMGFERNDLIDYLSFSAAKPFLMDGVEEEQWKALPQDRDSVIAQIKDYMPFAWEKANEGRGLSSGRSMSHFMAWIWVAGDDLGELTNYQYYGKDNLVRICQHYGIDYTQWDDGVREN